LGREEIADRCRLGKVNSALVCWPGPEIRIETTDQAQGLAPAADGFFRNLGERTAR
jgi:hypothetical protein